MIFWGQNFKVRINKFVPISIFSWKAGAVTTNMFTNFGSDIYPHSIRADRSTGVGTVRTIIATVALGGTIGSSVARVTAALPRSEITGTLLTLTSVLAPFSVVALGAFCKQVLTFCFSCMVTK